MAASDKKIAQMARDEDLVLSGLNKLAIKKKLGLTTVLDIPQTRELTGLEQQAVAYEIPYFDIDGSRLKHCRWKIISVSEDLPLKYYQEPKTIPRLYFPPLINWTKIAADVSIRIVITEGEKKAAKACLDGLPCFGLGGVWNWKSKKWAMPEIKDFDLIEWKGREVEVCYDADMSENENVARALAALCGTLAKRGARVFVRYLPASEGSSSLDEYLVKRGVKAYLNLECPEADFSREMKLLNDELIYVKNMVGYYAINEKIFYGTIHKLQQRYGDIMVIGESGKQIPAILEWAKWPHRHMVKDLTYEPGKDRFANGSFNSWQGWGVDPKRGNVGGFLEVIKSIEGWEWLLQWLAYPIQYPGTKLYTAALIWSTQTGTGKTFIGSVMQDIYGVDNTETITSVDLHDDRLSWLVNKQFILGEEVSSSNQRGDTGVLKHMITGRTIRVNEKYQPAYTLLNKTNFMFTSNNPDAVRIERGDRRFWVGLLDQHRPQKFWDDLDTWRKNGGAAAFRYHLMNKVDCSSFNPRARAPETVEKEHMVYTGMSSLEQWCEDFLADPDRWFGDMKIALKGRDVFEVRDIEMFLPTDIDRHKPANTAIGRALTRAGVVRAGVVRVGGQTKRLMAIRNLEHWRKYVNDKNLWAKNYLLSSTLAGVTDITTKRKRRDG